MFCSLWFAINWRSIICKLLFTFRQVTVITPLPSGRGKGEPHPTSPKGEECLYAHKRVNIRPFPTHLSKELASLSLPLSGESEGAFLTSPSPSAIPLYQVL